MATILSNRPDALPADIYALDLPIQYQVRNSNTFNVGAGAVTAFKGGVNAVGESTILTLNGSGFSYGVDDGNPNTIDGPTAGSISSAWIYFDDVITTPAPSAVTVPPVQTVFYVDLPTPVAVRPGMFADKNIFFSTFLSGDDVGVINVLALQKFAADGLNVTAALSSITGGNDQLSITGTAEPFLASPGAYTGLHAYSGDFLEIGVGAIVTGGNDIINYSGPTILMPIYGDAETVRGTLTGGNDVINLSGAVFLNGIPTNVTGVAAYGDAKLVTAPAAPGGPGGVVVGGHDQIVGSRFADILYGDVGDVEASARLRPGNDLLFGEGGSDTIYGDYGTLAVGAVLEAGGNDTIVGGAFFDIMYGQGGDDLFILENAADHDPAERIDGGSGTDTLLFKPSTAGQTLVLSSVVIDVEIIRIGEAGFSTSAIDANLDARAVTAGGFNIFGSDGRNLVFATDQSDNIAGLAGADTLFGLVGDDTLDGGAGDDSMDGSVGNDIYIVDSAGDRVLESGTDPGDEIRTTLNAFNLDGIGVEKLTFIGTGDFGGEGNGSANAITGGSGNDNMNGRGGADTLVGGAGNDRFNYDSAADMAGDSIDGGGNAGGVDTIAINFTGDANLTVANGVRIGSTGGSTSIEYIALFGGGAHNVILDAAQFGGGGLSTGLILQGDSGADTVTINGISGTFSAGAFDPIAWNQAQDRIVLNGGDGSDTITGSSGADSITGGSGADMLAGGLLTDTLNGGLGDDVLEGDSGSDMLNGDEGNDTLYAGLRTNTASSGSPEQMNGGADNDTLYGSRGNDTLNGGVGDDVLNGGDGMDIADWSESTGNVTVQLAADGAGTFANAATGTDTFTSIEGVRSGGGNDRIIGNARANILAGNGGADVLIGDGPLSLSAEAQSIRRLYIATLDRAPDAGGWIDWATQSEIGVSLNDIAAGFVSSDEFQGKYGPLDNTQFVTRLYRNVLDREPDGGGLVAYTVALTTGALTRTQVVTSFSESPEFVAGTSTTVHAGQVYRLYGATLGRAPDAGGFETWTDALGGGRSLVDITAGFVNSDEFIGKYGNQDNTGFVTLLYQNVLGRAPDAGGLAFWTGQLDTSAQTRTQVVTGFSESVEYINGTRAGVDGFMRTGMTAWSDTLIGGAGDDKLTGGRGSDRFVFLASEPSNDTVYGFDSFDTLQLTGFGFASSAEALAAITQQGANAVLSYTGGSITFADTQVSVLQSLTAQGWVLG